MAPVFRLQRLLIFGCVALIGGVWSLSGVEAEPPAASDVQAPPILGLVPPFVLTDQAGRPFTQHDLEGKVWLADFIFTRCAGQCPMISGRMARLQDAFAQEPRVRLISFSVDPAYDTPERLSVYAGQQQADASRWTFLTGSEPLMRQLVQEGFRLSLIEGDDPKEPILHSVRIVLIDHRGAIRGYYDAMEDAAIDRLTTDARRVLHDAEWP